MIAWAWVKHAEYRERYRTAAANPGDLRFVRIATDADARALLDSARPPT